MDNTKNKIAEALDHIVNLIIPKYKDQDHLKIEITQSTNVRIVLMNKQTITAQAVSIF